MRAFIAPWVTPYTKGAPDLASWVMTSPLSISALVSNRQPAREAGAVAPCRYAPA